MALMKRVTRVRTNEQGATFKQARRTCLWKMATSRKSVAKINIRILFIIFRLDGVSK